MSKAHLQLISGILGERYVTFYPIMVKDLGLPAAIILGKFIYWHNAKDNQQNGFYFKTYEKLLQETGIGFDAQKRAIRKLKARGFIYPTKYDYRHRRLFKLNMSEVRKYATELAETSKSNQGKSTGRYDDNQQTEKKQDEKTEVNFIEKDYKNTSLKISKANFNSEHQKLIASKSLRPP